MPEYCSRTNVENRLTTQGLQFLTDRDLDDEVSEAEQVAYVDTAIEEAGVFIDMHIQHLLIVSTARASGNVLLRMICTELAVERLAQLGGNDPPLSVVLEAERVRGILKDIKSGVVTIPGIVYPKPKIPTGLERPATSYVKNL